MDQKLRNKQRDDKQSKAASLKRSVQNSKVQDLKEFIAQTQLSLIREILFPFLICIRQWS